MSTRRSRRLKRERQRRKHNLALQLPPQRKVTTAQLFELIEKLAHVCRDAIAELEANKL